MLAFRRALAFNGLAKRIAGVLCPNHASRVAGPKLTSTDFAAWASWYAAHLAKSGHQSTGTETPT